MSQVSNLASKSVNVIPCTIPMIVCKQHSEADVPLYNLYVIITRLACIITYFLWLEPI